MTNEYNKLYINYLGVLSLLGRFTQELSPDDRECVDRAFADANEILTEHESDYVFKKCISGCYDMFAKQWFEEDGDDIRRTNAKDSTKGLE